MHREAWQDTLSDLVTTIKGDQSVKKLTSDVANTQASILIDTVDHPFPFTEPTTSSYKSTASLRRARSFKNTPRGSYTETVKLKHDQSKRMLAHTAKAMQALGIDYSSNALSKGGNIILCYTFAHAFLHNILAFTVCVLYC